MGETSFASRFFFNISEISANIKSRLNTSLKKFMIFLYGTKLKIVWMKITTFF